MAKEVMGVLQCRVRDVLSTIQTYNEEFNVYRMPGLCISHSISFIEGL